MTRNSELFICFCRDVLVQLRLLLAGLAANVKTSLIFD